MPSIPLTGLTVPNLKPVPGKRVTYLDKAIKGFVVRTMENGVKTYVLAYGEDRKRVKLGHVDIVALKDAREKAKDILAKGQLNTADDTPSIDFDEAFLRLRRPPPASIPPPTSPGRNLDRPVLLLSREHPLTSVRST